jgi:hypothetical protein
MSSESRSRMISVKARVRPEERREVRGVKRPNFERGGVAGEKLS